MSSPSLKASLSDLQPQLAATAVSPKGFKTAIQSFIQFLISQQVPASLWVKLPKDDAWWQDIWQYGQQAAGCCIYTLGEQIGKPPENLAASLRTIAVEQTPELKREYLCMAVSESFVGVLFAARTEGKTAPGDKRTLQLYVSTAPKTVTAVSKGLKSIIEQGLSQIEQVQAKQTQTEQAEAAGIETESSGLAEPESMQTLQDRANQLDDQRFTAGAAALSQWERCFPSGLLEQATLPLSEAFLAWQIQFQEEMRSQLSEQRNIAKNGGSTSLNALSSDFLTQAKEALQSPLTTIKTALTLLGSPSLKLTQKQRYLEMISAQCEQQRTLISSTIKLLQLQTTQCSKAETIKLSDLIPGIVSTYQPLAEERGIMLAYTVPDDLATVTAVEAELKQVMIHLLRNGIQTTLKGGRVWVSATTHNEKLMAISVQDSSGGIAQSDLGRVFEAFSPVSINVGDSDTGLEFTLMQQLVQRMGGQISVDSTVNQGTTFTVLLPMAKKQATAAQAEQAKETSAETATPITQAVTQPKRETFGKTAEHNSAEHKSAEHKSTEHGAQNAMASSPN